VGGQGGSFPPGDILGPLDDFCPPQTFILGHNSQRTLVSGSKRRSKSGEDLFFRRTLDFRDKWTSNSGKDLFFFFWRTLDFRAIWITNSGEDLFFIFIFYVLENANLWDRKQSLYREEPIFALQTLAPLVLPPCPRIVHAR